MHKHTWAWRFCLGISSNSLLGGDSAKHPNSQHYDKPVHFNQHICALLCVFWHLFPCLKSQGAKEQSGCLCVPLFITDSPSALNSHWNQVNREVKDQALCLTLSDTWDTAQGPRPINQHFCYLQTKLQAQMCFSLEGKWEQNTLLGYHCSGRDRSSSDMRRNWTISYLCL